MDLVRVVRAFGWDGKILLRLTFPARDRKDAERSAWTAMGRADVARVESVPEGG